MNKSIGCFKKAVTSAMALLLAGSMTMSAFAASSGGFSRVRIYDLMLQSEDTVPQGTGKDTFQVEGITSGEVPSDAMAEVDLQNLSYLEEDDRIYYIDGTSLNASAQNAEEALQIANLLIPVLGCPEETQLALYTKLRISDDLNIYVFQQIFEGATVPGSTIRIVTDAQGQAAAVFNSLSQELPESTGVKVVDEDAAQRSVEAALNEQHSKAAILPEFTAQILLPQEDEEDVTSNEILPDLLYWVVYTDNPEGDPVYPYQAHYVSAEGAWLYCNDVKAPADEAGWSGFTAAYTFDNLEPAQWSGTVTSFNGDTEEITVPVMLDPETGIYYLGDVERQIVVGEYYDFAYDEEELVMVSSTDNTEWKDDDLLTYANYIKVWDSYADLGWTGPDGNHTPSLLLRDLCLEDGEPMDNAAYMGHYRGWQIFGYDNSSSYLGEALDVIAHEFTHCVTQSAQGVNLYLNDFGAINESLSDIMGNLIETELDEDEDPEWLLGEDTVAAIRSMLNPRDYDQPEYIWDVYYTPTTQTPNDMNDRGGVHVNSSILNRLAARMYLEEGMSLEEMKLFWMTVIFAMTPETDLYQMADLLPWALQVSGNARYEAALAACIADGQLTRKEIPQELEPGRTLVSLQLPDTPALSDENWILEAFQWKGSGIVEVMGLLARFWLSESDEDVTADAAEEEVFTKLFGIHNTWVSDESRTMNMVIEEGTSVYVLFNMDPATYDLKGAAVLLGNRWIDIGSVLGGVQLDTTASEKMSEEVFSYILEGGMQMGADLISALLSEDSETESDEENSVTLLPTEGLESVRLMD